MPGADVTSAQGHRRAVHCVHVKYVQGSGGANDVDERVVAAEFVQVHLGRAGGVQPCLGFGDGGQRADGQVGDRLGPGAGRQCDQVCGLPFRRGVLDMDVDAGGRQAVAGDGLAGQLPSGQAGGADRVPDGGQRGTRVEQRPAACRPRDP